MADEKAGGAESSKDSPDQMQAFAPERDWFLQMLVNQTNNEDLYSGLGITLLCGGAMVSGNLISAKRYFQRFGEALAAASGGDAEGKERLANTFAELGDPEKLRERYGLPEQEQQHLPSFIHLEDVRVIYLTGTIPAGQARALSFWRGRLAAVDGFMLGSMESKPA